MARKAAALGKQSRRRVERSPGKTPSAVRLPRGFVRGESDGRLRCEHGSKGRTLDGRWGEAGRRAGQSGARLGGWTEPSPALAGGHAAGGPAHVSSPRG